MNEALKIIEILAFLLCAVRFTGLVINFIQGVKAKTVFEQKIRINAGSICLIHFIIALAVGLTIHFVR